MEPGPPARFAPAVLAGLAGIGPVDGAGDDLSLELGLSVWLRRTGTSLAGAVGELLAVRRAVLEVSDLDASTELVPLVGRSPRSDVLVLATYVSDLLERAMAVSGLPTRVLLAQVVAALPEAQTRAVGA
jgi:hypothetical protein